MIGFAALALTLISIPAEDQHPYTVHDMLAMDRISDPAVSPDGKWVAYTVRVTDVEANKGRNDVWISAVDGSSSRQVTAHEANDSGARWTRDGKSLFFLSTRSGSSQVWKVAIEGGEAVQVTKLPVDVENMLPFPDDKTLLLTMEVYPDASKEPGASKDQALEETARRDADKEKSKVKARIYESLLFRHWDTWEDGKRSHVFTWTPEAGARDLMPGFDGDAPTKPFGGLEEISMSPDAKEIAFAAQKMTKDAAWSTDVNVYTVPADGSAEPKCLSCDNRATDTQPAYSPDGHYLAWLAMHKPGYESDKNRIMLFDRQSGEKKVWSETWDRSPSEISWSADSKTIWTSLDNFGNKPILRLPVPAAMGRILIAKGTNSSPRQAGDRLLFVQDSLTSPAEIWTTAFDGSDLRPVTKLNEKKVAATKMGTFDPFTFKGAKGLKIYGFIVRPVDYRADDVEKGKKYPVALLIHGGPQGSFGDHFHYRWNPQVYAGAGFAVIMIDFHGSTGYGQAFTDSINGDWGGAPYEDLMLGLDWALDHCSFMDKSKVVALGASYGGYMVNWIAGQTDRFQCLVSHDGNLDERMAYFDTEEL